MLCEKNKCTACGACYNICPQNCIQIILDEEGFHRPVIGKGCINCGRCEKACPIITEIKNRSIEMPDIYTLISNDNDILKKSASGGAFTVLSNQIYNQGGIVYGAKMGDDFNVRICAAENDQQLEPLRGSKYVESFVGNCYKEIKKNLEEKRLVLFTGLPCQIAGLYGYLGGDHEYLITAEITCHGVSSGKLFQSYIDYTEKEFNKKIVSITQRDKSKKWSPLIPIQIRIVFDDNTVCYRDSSQDPYLTGYLKGLTYRPGCYTCKFAAIPRIADITMGDFMGLGTIHSSKSNCANGVSQVLINTQKGADFFSECQNNAKIEKRDLIEGVTFNMSLWHPTPKHSDRDNFYIDFKNLSFEQLRKKYLDKNIKHIIKREIKKIIKTILGARLTVRGMLIYYNISGKLKPIEAIILKQENIKNQ